MAKNDNLTALQLISTAQKGNFAPVYILMGEEGYYIDSICEAVTQNALTDDERDFNQSTFYGLDSDARVIVNTCKRFPVMAARQLVVVREAQLLDNLDLLHHYVANPLKSTILVVCYKGGNIKATSELMKAAKASADAVVFESKKLTEAGVGPLLQEYVQHKQLKIEGKALAMMKDYVGTDLSRLFGEVDKLALILQPGAEITPEQIERHIGISKDYNNFELVNAVRERNIGKALAIVAYFKKNPKNNPTVLATAILFKTFADLLLLHTARDRSEKGLMDAVGARSPWALRQLTPALRLYNASSCYKSIGYIREFDRASKGIDSRANEYDALIELIFKIIRS